LPREDTTLHALDNHLLDALSEEVRATFVDAAERTTLATRASVYEPGAQIEHLYFPINAVISVVTVMRDGTQIEVITIGREGLTGAQAVLDGSPATGSTWCQVAGEVFKIAFPTLTTLCVAHPDLRALIERYISAQIDVLSQSIACNRLHYVNERCARWLLTTHDRVGRDDFPLTHETLATMLGVRRAGVSIAAAALQEAGIIRYVRGKFTIVDRDGLERAACECYGAINEAFTRRRLPAA
jgi:CRP-like cAMP-binding protein